MGIVASDDFDRTPGDAISVGYPWTLASGSTVVISSGQRAYVTTNTATLYTQSGVVYPDDYEVSLDLFRLSAGGYSAGPIGRVSSSSAFYHARYDTNSGAWQLYQFGPAVLLGSWSESVAVGAYRRLTLRMVGDQISMLVDGVERVTATNSVHSAGGVAGFRVLGMGTNTTGMHIDNWIAKTLGGIPLPLLEGYL